MKRIICIIFLIALAIPSAACAQNDYRTDVSAEELVSMVKTALPLPDGYASHGGDYLDFRFEGIDAYIENYAIIYSRDTRYADLVAIFKAKSPDDANKAAELCEQFIEDQRALFSGIVERYLPSEKEKLESAKTERIGSYVIVSILSPSDAAKALSAIKTALK